MGAGLDFLAGLQKRAPAAVRGARMAELSYSQARQTQQQRLTDPMVWRYGTMQPTSETMSSR